MTFRRFIALRMVILAFRLCPGIKQPIMKAIHHQNQRDQILAEAGYDRHGTGL